MKMVNARYIMVLAASLLMPVLQAAEVMGDSKRGEVLWSQEFTVQGKQRSCTTCHSADPGKTGKHQRTGKLIEPMAPAADRKRFTDPKKVAKWFKRNCKWTLERECTVQEKADVIEYLKTY